MIVLLLYSPDGTQGFSCGIGMCSSITSEHGMFFSALACGLSQFFCLHSFELVSYAQVILGEEVAASKLTIFDITKQICDAVQARAEKGWSTSLLYLRRWYVHVLFYLYNDNDNLLMFPVPFTDKNHGVILIPEGLVESIPELYALLQVRLHVLWLPIYNFTDWSYLFIGNPWSPRPRCFCWEYLFSAFTLGISTLWVFAPFYQEAGRYCFHLIILGCL